MYFCIEIRQDLRSHQSRNKMSAKGADFKLILIMKKLFLCVVFLGFVGSAAFAQYDDYVYPQNPKVYAGVGFGFDYGGIGAKLEFLPIDNVGLFAGAGYNLLSLGWNVGGAFRMAPHKKVSPNLMVMYGYNGVILGSDSYSKQYEMTSYGVTFGLNLDIKVGRKSKISTGLLVPIRSQKFRDNYDDAKNDSNMEISELLPIGITIGFNFGF